MEYARLGDTDLTVSELAFGTAPLGSLLAGVIADAIGPAGTVVLGGAGVVIAAGWFSLRLPGIRRLLRPIYAERGIIGPPRDPATAL